MKCANCNNDAKYLYKITTKTTIPYCEKDLPKFLIERVKAGLLETTDAYKATVADGLTTIATDMTPTVDETPKAKKQAPKKTDE